MGFFYFLRQKKFYMHLLLVLLLLLVLIWAVLKSLNAYTRHGQVFIVPDFEGEHFESVMNQYGEQFNFLVIDSVYHKEIENGSVIMQNPSAGSKVKLGRNVYLTIIAKMPEQVPMPNLRNLSLRQAIVTLNLNGLYINELIFVDHFARNAVVEQQINNEIIEPETLVFKGTPVDLFVGNGGASTMVPLPSILGSSPNEVVSLLHNASLNKGEEIYMDGYDSINSRVYRTEPSSLRISSIPIGSKVDIWYRSLAKFDFNTYLELISSDTIPVDTLSIIFNDPHL
jgi:eukaryotic-like serine/threonine-protein kinase